MDSTLIMSKLLVKQSPRRVTIWPWMLDHSGDAIHRWPRSELEKQLKKMKPSQVISICLDLASQLRIWEKELFLMHQNESQDINIGLQGVCLTVKIFESR